MSRVKERITSKEETLVKPESRKYSQSESEISCEEIDVESISPQKQKNETSRNESSNSDKSPIKSPVKKKKRKQDTANFITPRHAALKSTKHSSAFGVICGTCVIVVALFISILINYVSGGTSDNIKTNEELHHLQNQFLNNFHLLQKQFPGLSNRFWSVTGIPIQSVIYNPLSRQPAVIVIVNPPGKNNQGNRIATKLSQIYPAAKKPVFINSTEYRQEDPDLIKYHLDSLLSKGLMMEVSQQLSIN
uniref:Uncharacterized protein LOC102803958 n=1 Tax=Saccoglossus kowalevskii TaxID=10224 RepID=A0ABM0M4H5_SACKO|nr:PREDICTED: uncharacterized protein LOC102803958 [Saccoglossus kowalevskii]